VGLVVGKVKLTVASLYQTCSKFVASVEAVLITVLLIIMILNTVDAISNDSRVTVLLLMLFLIVGALLTMDRRE